MFIPRKLFLVMLVLLSFVTVSADQTAPLDVPGRIAYIGSDNNVYTVSLHDTVEIVAMTADASRTRRYQWPTWSTSGKLAYFCCDSFYSARFATEVFVSPNGVDTAELVYEGDQETFTYANWSPEDCDAGAGCRELGVLLSQPEGYFHVEVVRSSRAGSSSVTLGQGQPFYFSWSPDGRQMLWQRDARRLERYTLATQEVEKLRAFPGGMQAGDWSPVDDRLLFGELGEEENTTDLVIFSDNDQLVLETGLQGLVSFNWSPDGNYVAYRVLRNDLISPVFVLDSVSGEVVAQSRSDNIVSFFWSPDSSKIAFVTITTGGGGFSAERGQLVDQRVQDVEGIVWGALDVEADTTRLYGSFIPTTEMIYMFNFFDQFAQSHSIWSPDSTHIVFSEFTPEGNSVVNVLDMTRADSVPFYIADGSIGIWSYR
ncbi:MAG: hypothetical protein OHK0046_34470 [Anaerolineae bacterium]